MKKTLKSKGFTIGWGLKSEKKDVQLAFYRRYTAMRARCYQKNNKSYKYYGGKGIIVEWQTFRDFHSDMFETFVEHVDIYGIQNTTLDRISNAGNYGKDNCRWATREQQSLNSSKPVIVSFEGVLYSASSLARKTGVPVHTLQRRLKRGMSPEIAVAMPVKLGAHQYDA
jgi:hypothetical protein